VFLLESHFINNNMMLWPLIKKDYLLNLSILISSGKETNWDVLSNGEWSGQKPKFKIYTVLLSYSVEIVSNCSLMIDYSLINHSSSLNYQIRKVCLRGWKPRKIRRLRKLEFIIQRVELFGIATLIKEIDLF